MIKRYHLIPLAVLLLGGLACSFMTPSNPTRGSLGNDPPSVTPSPIPTLESTPIPPTFTPTPESTRSAIPSPELCKVHTGIPGGALNVRSCDSVRCPALGVIYEGESVTLINPAGNPWAEVRAGDLQGWAYSNYLECEP